MTKNTKMTMLAVLACSQFLAACAFQPVSSTPDAIRASISSGDTVRVTTQNGRENTVRVTDVGSDRFSSGNEEFAYGHIVQLEKREINRPVLWVILGLAVAGLAGGSGGGGAY